MGLRTLNMLHTLEFDVGEILDGAAYTLCVSSTACSDSSDVMTGVFKRGVILQLDGLRPG